MIDIYISIYWYLIYNNLYIYYNIYYNYIYYIVVFSYKSIFLINKNNERTILSSIYDIKNYFEIDII